MTIESGKTLGSFEILGLLGVGGMGEVYRARDLKLGREVAIKVLPESVAADAARLARFEREAKLLASLDHPNIATIHDFQEADGAHFLIMQLVEGATLAKRLARGALSVSEALPLFSHIADGLASAHERGIVHRDLKPANLKIDPNGRVKILDFGLAKAFLPRFTGTASEAPTVPIASDRSEATQEGSILGTPAYMSPEQARGQAVDNRTDIWAFGVCLYEAITGRRPFRGESSSDILADILRSEPDWTRVPEELPPHLASLLKRCLEKDLRRRLSSIADIAITLEDTVSGWNRSFPTPTPSPVPGQPGYAAPSPAPSPSSSAPAAPTPTPDIAKRIDRIAVLPFDNLMGDEAQEHFVYGMSDALSTELSKMTGVEVVSHNSAMRYKGTDKLPKQIALELGVDGLLAGAIMRAGEDIRITVRLIDGKTDRQVWGDHYEGKHAQILSLQGQVALAVAEQISTSLTPEDRLKSINAPEVNPEAHEACLLGYYFVLRQSAENFMRSVEQFRKSIAIAPDYAPGYEGMADLYVGMASNGVIAPREGFSEACGYARKAIELDPTSGVGYRVLGFAGMPLDRDWAESERLVDKAIELDRDNALTRTYQALLFIITGRHDETERACATACSLDPLNAIHWDVRGLAAYNRRDPETALMHLDRGAALDPDSLVGLQNRILSLVMLGRHDAAIKVADRLLSVHGSFVNAIQHAAYAYARGGRKDEARRLLARLQNDHERIIRGTFATGFRHIALGDYDRGLDEMEKSLETVDLLAITCGYHPFWDAVRSHPRFRAIRRKLGFTKDDDLDQMRGDLRDIDRFAVRSHPKQ